MFKRIKGKTFSFRRNILHIVFICASVVLLGLFGMLFLRSMKDPPEKISGAESYVVVKTLKVSPSNYNVNVVGHGRVRPVLEVSLASEISGRVVFTHPDLSPGKVIPKGEILFKIDDLNHTTNVKEIEAYVDQCWLLISNIKKEQEIDIRRIDGLEKNKLLTYDEFQRIKKLFEESNVGSEIDVHRAEKEYNLISDRVDEMLKIVSLYPAQIKHAENDLKAAEARLLRANANLKKCEIRAPFCSRVKASLVEKGELLSPGQEIAVLVDDSILEIEVFLDSSDVKRWLTFDENVDRLNWFPNVKPVLCKITWDEKDCFCEWEGCLNRVSGYDEKTHTIKVVVRICADPSLEGADVFPIAEGMFCTVNIPGKMMKNVYCLPRESVDFENRVCLVNESNRLKTLPVDVIRKEGKNIFVQGLNPGDVVITTRLLDPLEGMLVKIDDDIG